MQVEFEAVCRPKFMTFWGDVGDTMGPRFVAGRDIPDFGHAFSNYTYFRPTGRFWFSSVQRPRRLADEKKKEEEEEEETLVKYKSTDILCRAA